MTKAPPPRQYKAMGTSDRAPPVEAFDHVYERDFDYVWKTLGRLAVPPADLADAVHEVFVVLYRRWHELDHSQSLRPWLFGVARRHAASLRRKQREPQLGNHDAPAPEVPHEERQLLWLALAMLDEDRREVVVLHDLDGFTGKEIAELLGIPANTVHSRLRLARADLAAAIDRLERQR